MPVEMATKVSSKQVISSLKGKRLKQFLGKNETLSLAAAISDVQEKKMQLKMDRNHGLQQATQPQQIPNKTVSRSKSKLKETKDMLVARRMQAKRDKVRSRKQRLQGDVECQEGSKGRSVDTVHKKVSFL